MLALARTIIWLSGTLNTNSSKKCLISAGYTDRLSYRIILNASLKFIEIGE